MCTLLLTLLLGVVMSGPPQAQVNDPGQLIDAGNGALKAGRFAEAERLFRQALAIYQASSPDSNNTGVAAFNLGLALQRQFKHEEAEAAYRTSHSISLRLKGPEHAETIDTLIRIGDTRRAQSKFSLAETDYRVALAARERSLGANHPDTLIALDRVVLAVEGQKRYNEAEPLIRRLVTGHEIAHGPAHAATAEALMDLASNLGLQNRHADAEPVFRRALGIMEGARGFDHPDTLRAATRFALHFEYRERYADAEVLRRRVFAALLKSDGTSSPKTAEYALDFGYVLERQKKWSEALDLYSQAVAAFEKTNGAADPGTLRALDRLRHLYGSQDKHSDAERIARRTLDAVEKSPGPKREEVVQRLHDLAYTLARQEKDVEREQVLRRAAAIAEEAPDGPWFATSLLTLGYALEDQDRYAEAEGVFRREASLRERAQGPDSWETRFALRNLARMLHQQDKFAESEAIRDRLLKSNEKEFGLQSKQVALTRLDFAEFDLRRRRFQHALDGVDSALRVLRSLTAGDGDRYGALVIRGKALVGLQRFDEGMATLQQAASLLQRTEPQESLFRNQVHRVFGTELMKQARFSEAEAAFRQAHDGASRLGDDAAMKSIMLLELGYALGYQNRLDEALKVFESARQIRASADGVWAVSLVSAHQAVAWTMLRQSRFLAAEQNALSATKLAPSFGSTKLELAAAWTTLARARVGLKKLAEAESAAREALTLTRKMPAGDPRIAQTLHVLGMIAEAKGDLAAARSRYGEALAIREKAFADTHPDIAESRGALARIAQGG